jgi:uncharacterized membrane protein
VERCSVATKRWLLIAVLVTALVAVVLALTDTQAGPVRALCGAALVLVGSGYALSLVLFRPPRLPGAERILTSVGLSLALSVAAGLLLNLSHRGLTPAREALLLGGLTLGVGGYAAVRDRVRLSSGVRPERVQIPRAHGALFGLAAAVGILALGVAHYSVLHQPAAGLTQLWVQPATEQAVVVGIRTSGGAPNTFSVEVRLGGSVVREIPQIHVLPGQTWQTQVELPAAPSDLAPVDVDLFLPSQAGAAYRQVSLR